MLEGCTCGDDLGAGLDELAAAFAPRQATVTDETGTFVLRGLPSGVEFQLRASNGLFFAAQSGP